MDFKPVTTLALVKALGFCVMTTLAGPASAQADEFNLPSLGDTSSSIMSREQEYQLGRAWVSMLRGSVATMDDPLLKDFVERHVFSLAETSQLTDRRLTFVLIESPQLNAFAAPGGVVGVNGGLFLNAHTEAEFASVMAHELAHLSQRHFSRGLEQQQRMRIPVMTAMLASVILAAAGVMRASPRWRRPRPQPFRNSAGFPGRTSRRQTASAFSISIRLATTLRPCLTCSSGSRGSAVLAARLPNSC